MKSQETPEWVLRRASPGCQEDHEDWPHSWEADAQQSLPKVCVQAERDWWPILVHVVRIGWEDAHRNLRQSERGTKLTQRTELNFFRAVLYRLGEWAIDLSFLLRHQTTCLKSPSKRQTWVLREERLDGKWLNHQAALLTPYFLQASGDISGCTEGGPQDDYFVVH